MSNELLRRFEQLNEIGVSLSSETSTEHLLEKILLAAKTITQADGGTLYRMNEDRKSLRFSIVRTTSLGLALGGSSKPIVTDVFKDLPLYLENGEANNSLVAVCAALTEKTINIADAYTEKSFDFSGTRHFDKSTGYRSQSFLTVPMKNHENEIIGVLQLINAIDQEAGKVRSFSEADQRLAESLASQAAVALTNQQLIQQLQTLFESFVMLINLAIDEKSPHTAEHCQHVPKLTMSLAKACVATKEGPLADFSLNEKEMYELKIASMLHDCGKVTTPVHIVDKSTKLQTIFDRIALINTRFEVLRRDAEIAMLRDIMAGKDPVLAQQKFATYQEKLEADRAFLQHANKGSESMLDSDLERIRAIDQNYRWKIQDEEISFLSSNELENLMVRAGTLTQDERKIVNHHIVSTIRMLESLPWPKHLRRVPEYAGAHHERIDGKGYPKGLTKEQMSIPARIMAIADIFEALTAGNRPYKTAMTLSQALEILKRFSENGHLDPDLFAIFIKEKVYVDYAKERGLKLDE